MLDLQDVRRTYESPAGPVHALRHGTLSLERGELLAIVGPSGSGKSTLLSLMGLLDRPTAGAYFLLGQDTTSLTEREQTRLRAHLLGFVFQAYHLVPHKSALGNVVLPLLYTGRPRGQRREVAEAALRQVGLEDRMRAKVQTLSGGEKQRVAIARAVVHSPSVLLCDEPTGNLDSANSQRIMALLSGLAHSGLAVVVVTHDRDVAAGADRQVSVIDGVTSSHITPHAQVH